MKRIGAGIRARRLCLAMVCALSCAWGAEAQEFVSTKSYVLWLTNGYHVTYHDCDAYPRGSVSVVSATYPLYVNTGTKDIYYNPADTGLLISLWSRTDVDTAWTDYEQYRARAAFKYTISGGGTHDLIGSDGENQYAMEALRNTSVAVERHLIKYFNNAGSWEIVHHDYAMVTTVAVKAIADDGAPSIGAYAEVTYARAEAASGTLGLRVDDGVSGVGELAVVGSVPAGAVAVRLTDGTGGVGGTKNYVAEAANPSPGIGGVVRIEGFVATDHVGNAYTSGPAYVVFDSEAPSIAQAYVDGGVLRIEASDDVSGIRTITVTPSELGQQAVTVTIAAPDYASGVGGTISREVSGLSEDCEYTVSVTDHAGNASGVVRATRKHDPGNYDIAYVGGIAYEAARGGYVARLGIPVDAFGEAEAGDELVIERAVAVGGENAGTLTGYAGSSAASVGSYEGETWVVSVSALTTQTVAEGRYVLVDVLPAGGRYAHGVVSYAARLRSGGADKGAYRMPAAGVKIANTAAAARFVAVDGNGSELASLGGGAVGRVYANTRSDGNAKSAWTIELRYAGGADADGDSLGYAAVSGSGRVELGGGAAKLAEALAAAGAVPGAEVALRDYDTITIEVEERSGNAEAVEGPRSSAGLSVTVDNAAPRVVSVGRELGGNLVNFTTSPGFELSAGAEDNTGVSTIRVWVSSKDGATQGTPVDWVRARTAGELTLSDGELARLASGSGLSVTWEGLGGRLADAKLPWRLPDEDADYGITVAVIDAAGNEARPLARIMLSRNLSAGEWTLELDPNAELVFARPADCGGSGESAEARVPFYVMGAPAGVIVRAAASLRGDGYAPSASASVDGNGVGVASFASAVYGTYDAVVTAEVEGIERSARTSVRVNEPAKASLSELRTTSGKRVTLDFGTAGAGGSPVLTIGDEAADGPYEVAWTITDGHGVTSELARSAEAGEYVFVKDMAAAEAVYTVKARVWDRYGAESEATCEVAVTNTSAGELASDELWLGEQRLRGTVVVPAGVTLTIGSGCAVTPEGMGEGAGVAEREAWRIEVAAGGRLVVESGAVLGGAIGGPRWGGIRSYGETSVDGATIRNAVQGLAVGGETGTGAVAIGTIFEGNVVGVHAVAGTPEVRGSTFAGNAGYGIKSEAGAAPAVLDSTFTGNAYDYYDGEHGLVLTAGAMNAMAGNAGNR